MKLDKRFIPALMVYIIIFLVVTIVYFVVPFEKSVVSVISFAFFTLSLLLSLWLSYRAFSGERELRSKVYGFPMFRVGAICFVLHFIFLVFMSVLGVFIEVPIWIAFIVPILLLGGAGIGSIAAEEARNIIEQQEYRDAQKIKNMTYFKTDISGIVNKCTDPQLKKELSKLSEKFRFSDPVSSDRLSEIESRISAELQLLELDVNKDNDSATKRTAEIERLLSERNIRCKALK